MLKHVDSLEVPNRWYCGPYALAAILDSSVPFVTDLVRALRRAQGKRPRHVVKRMNLNECRAILEAKGYRIAEERQTRYSRRHLCIHAWSKPEGTWLVRIPGHFMVLSSGFVYDNQEGKKAIADSKHKRKLVTHAWLINEPMTQQDAIAANTDMIGEGQDV